VTASPGGCAQPAQNIPGWRLWVSSTGRWWALCQTVLTATQVTAGCQPLIYAPTSPALAALIDEQDALRASCPAVLPRPPGRSGLACRIWG
jgi:hypothetical protein